jgi:lysophospholipase L1-like esterase
MRAHRTALVLLAFVVALPASAAERWVGTWASSPQLATPVQHPPGQGFADTTVRQLVRVSIGGKRIRVRLSNAFGTAPLTIVGAHVALANGAQSAIRADTDRALAFHGRASVTMPAGAVAVSDPLDFALPPLADVALSLYLKGAPDTITLHPGSRTTSYLQPGDALAAADLTAPAKIDHWYFINGIDVEAGPEAAAVIVLGDSITDGRGSTTNGNDRWPDRLARRLQANPATAQVAVLNHGIGGNRLLRDGLGPNALARLDRDVLAQTGARWLVVLEGVNDLGTRVAARTKGESWATADDIIGAYEQIARRAQAHGLRVYGATILPLEGFANYAAPDVEADRQRINDWIRTGGAFDGVVDFDRATRDPAHPARLSAAVDGGDHLHPSAAGYEVMANAVDLALFDLRSPAAGRKISPPR